MRAWPFAAYYARPALFHLHYGAGPIVRQRIRRKRNGTRSISSPPVRWSCGEAGLKNPRKSGRKLQAMGPIDSYGRYIYLFFSPTIVRDGSTLRSTLIYDSGSLPRLLISLVPSLFCPVDSVIINCVSVPPNIRHDCSSLIFSRNPNNG